MYASMSFAIAVALVQGAAPGTGELERRLLERGPIELSSELSGLPGTPPRDQLCIVNAGADNVLLGDWDGVEAGDTIEFQFPGGAAAGSLEVRTPPGWRAAIEDHAGWTSLRLRPGEPFVGLPRSERLCFELTGRRLPRGGQVTFSLHSWYPRAPLRPHPPR